MESNVVSAVGEPISASRAKSANRMNWKRRSYFINRNFQGRYTALIVTGVFLLSMIMSLALYWVLFQQARERVIQPGAASPWANTQVMVLAALAFSALASVAVGIWTIILTHRMCGPLYVLEQYLSELRAGHLPKRRSLRRKDEFKDLFERFWQMVDDIREQKESELATISETLKIARIGLDGDATTRQRTLDAIEHRLTRMQATHGRILAVGQSELDELATPCRANGDEDSFRAEHRIDSEYAPAEQQQATASR